MNASELWYLLHFEDVQNAIGRARIFKKLSGHLGRVYEKNDPDLFQELKQYHAVAHSRAERLDARYQATAPHTANPNTRVYVLVRELFDLKPG